MLKQWHSKSREKDKVWRRGILSTYPKMTHSFQPNPCPNSMLIRGLIHQFNISKPQPVLKFAHLNIWDFWRMFYIWNQIFHCSPPPQIIHVHICMKNAFSPSLIVLALLKRPSQFWDSKQILKSSKYKVKLCQRLVTKGKHSHPKVTNT